MEDTTDEMTLVEEDEDRGKAVEGKRHEEVEEAREPEPDPEKEGKMEEPEPEPGEMVEIASLNIGTAETHDDIAFGFKGEL